MANEGIGGGNIVKKIKYHEQGHKLDIFKKPVLDDLIVKEETVSYLPYTQNTDNSDTIRIEIQSSDIITATSDSFIKIIGTYAIKPEGKACTFVNNAPCFLFEEIRLKLGNNEIIDVCKQPGITSYLKGVVSYTELDGNGLSCSGWILNKGQHVFKNNKFSCIIPLKHLFGFCEDHRKLIVKMPQELILIRAKNDINCYKSEEGEVEFKITKISWEVPHVTLSEQANIDFLDRLRNTSGILAFYRRWELHELHSLPQSNKTIWRIKNTGQFDKPRYVVIALQKDKIDKKDADPTDLIHSHLTNIKVMLNSTEFPYQRMNLDFVNDDYLVAFINYKDFQKNYYHKTTTSSSSVKERCLFDYEKFKSNPVFVVNCMRQFESDKESPVDVKIELESSRNFEDGTKVYALILYDNIIQYNPFNEKVTKVAPE